MKNKKSTKEVSEQDTNQMNQTELLMPMFNSNSLLIEKNIYLKSAVWFF